MDRNTLVKRFVIGTFITLYALVSIISTIHVIDFFELSNPDWLAVTLAIGFEIGAAASLASLVILKKMNKTIVWSLFIAITLMQMQGNMYYAFINLEDFTAWSELFDLIEEDLIDQKRILAFVSGAILPLVALGFIKSLVDYIKPEEKVEVKEVTEDVFGDSDNEGSDIYTEDEIDSWGSDSDDGYYTTDMPEESDLKDFDVTINDGLEDEEFNLDNLSDEVIDEILEGEEIVVEVPEIKEVPSKKQIDDREFELGKNLFQNQVNSLAKSKGLKKREVVDEQTTNLGLADQVQKARQIIGGAELMNKKNT